MIASRELPSIGARRAGAPNRDTMQNCRRSSRSDAVRHRRWASQLYLRSCRSFWTLRRRPPPRGHHDHCRHSHSRQPQKPLFLVALAWPASERDKTSGPLLIAFAILLGQIGTPTQKNVGRLATALLPGIAGDGKWNVHFHGTVGTLPDIIASRSMTHSEK